MKSVIAALIFVLALGATVAHAQALPDISTYLENAAGATATSTAAASPVDLLLESDSYVPPFYAGRALPSPGSTMHMLAISHFTTAAGAPIADKDITYTWRVDGRVAGTVSGPGKSSAYLPAPTLFGTDVVSVDAHSSDGSAYGSASITVSSIDPQVTLYEDDPLIGIEYYSAIGSQYSVPDVEATFIAIPYFLASGNLGDPRLSWSWTIGQQPLDATTTGNEITINAQNSAGIAALALSLTATNNPLLEAQGNWNITFRGNGFGASAGQ